VGRKDSGGWGGMVKALLAACGDRGEVWVNVAAGPPAIPYQPEI